MKRSAWIVVGLLAIAPVCSAQAQELGPELTFHNVASRSSVTPKVAMDAAGRSVVVWASMDTRTSRWRVYGRRHLPDGRLGRLFTIGSRQGADQYEPAIDSDPVTGRFVVAWRDRVRDPSRVLAQMFLPTGKPMSRVLVVDNQRHPFQILPAVAMASDGGFFILWNGYADEAGDEFKMYGRRYNARGVARGPSFVVSTADPGEYAQICRTPSGGFIATWQSSTEDSELQRFDAEAQPVGDASVLTGASNVRPMCRFEDDGFVLGWTGVEAGAQVAYVQAFDAEAAPLGDPQSLASDTDLLRPGFQSAAPLPGGAFLATWFGGRPEGDGEVFGRWMTAAGEPASDPFQINVTAEETQFGIAVASAPGRDLLAVWQSASGDVSWAILGRTISPPAP